MKKTIFIKSYFKDRASIDFVVDQVVKFAKETRAKNVDWEVELGCGSSAGTKYDQVLLDSREHDSYFPPREIIRA